MSELACAVSVTSDALDSPIDKRSIKTDTAAAHWSREHSMIIPRHFVTTLLIASSCLVACRKSKSTSNSGGTVTVTILRVESNSPEQAGAEHCDLQLKTCTPLAASQKISATGLVRTFAGGKVSLDFGAGRRVDLDGLSQLELDTHIAHLKQGHFSIDSTPLIQKEPLDQLIVPLKFSAGGSVFSSDAKRPTTTALSVAGDQAFLTVRRGALQSPGLDIEPRVGQSIRVTKARAFRTATTGVELPSLAMAAPRAAEYGELLSNVPPTRRGLGTMSARLPNTDQKRDGVRLLKHHAKVIIYDGYARTEIEEEFENTTPHILEGNYRFPIPSDASVARLGLWVGDQLMEGEVLERTRAAAIYKSIVDRPVPRDPALLQWENAGELSLRVFPILAHNTRKLVLAYHQTLSAEGDRLRYVYPLSLGSERETQIEDFSIEVIANDTSADLSHPVTRDYDAIVQKEGASYKVRYEAKQFRPQRDFSVVFERDAREGAQLSAHLTKGAPPDPYLTAVASTNSPPLSLPSFRPSVQAKTQAAAEEGYFGLRFTVDLPETPLRPAFRQLKRAIVLDVSQSQSLATIRAQAALTFGLLLEMDPDEPFVLLACDSACESWSSAQSPSTEISSTLRLPARLAAAHTFLMALKPGGASDIAGSLATALVQLGHAEQEGLYTHQLVYIGDGHPSAGELSAASIAARVQELMGQSATELRFIGAGRSLDQDVLRGLAIELGGTVDLLSSGLSLEERIMEISSALRRPIIKDARLSLPPGLISADTNALPALRLGQEILISGEILDLDPGDVVLTGTLAGKPYRLSKKLVFQEQNRRQNPLIANMWAKNRISLLQSLAPTAEIKAQIIDLSLRYRTMSRYTSFLVLESDEMYKDFGILRPKREAKADESETFMQQMESEPAPAPVAQDDAPYAMDLTSREEGAVASSRGAPAAPVAPAAASAPKPSAAAPAKSKKAESWDNMGSAFGSGAPGSGRALESKDVATDKGRAAEQERSLADRPVGENLSKPSAPSERSRYVAPRFHMKATTTGDEWRKWGQERLTQLEQSLQADPNSRARHEVWVRGLITSGRFAQAQAAAHNFFSLDPDYPVAARLLAFSSVLSEDHEQARLMLDVLNEQSPEQTELHIEAERAFLAVGDVVRACAHVRSVAALDPHLNAYVAAADQCWQEILGRAPSRSNDGSTKGEPGQLEVSVECDAPSGARDCPSPLLISPYGEVYSPWTPGLGKTDKTRITLLKVRTGTYRLLIAGGSPSARGRLKVVGRHENTSLKFDHGALHTVADITFNYY